MWRSFPTFFNLSHFYKTTPILEVKHIISTLNERVWCITQLAKLSFNHSIGRTHSWRFSIFTKNRKTFKVDGPMLDGSPVLPQISKLQIPSKTSPRRFLMCAPCCRRWLITYWRMWRYDLEWLQRLALTANKLTDGACKMHEAGIYWCFKGRFRPTKGWEQRSAVSRVRGTLKIDEEE